MEITQFQQKDRRSDALGDLRVLPDELICAILESLNPIDAARLSCVSSVMYIFCNEEPLWMTLCLKNGGRLEYKSSWKDTTLYQRNVSNAYAESCRKHLHFDGFYSLFLHRRWYRCFTVLDKFYMDRGDLERKNNLTLEEFRRDYDGRKPVLLTGLTETWPARSTWTIDQLLCKYGDTLFRISQRSSKKITMRFKDYVSYMNIQHDEDPLYIFDDKFGETAPNLLKDYSVPHLFQEDFFDVLDRDQRPPFRWLIIGPERSGASWHVDPALTSAWNTLLFGRKRWALYPPGKVPLGVTVHVNEEDGDVNVETPSSLQWWLDFYPLLGDHDKPIELTQHPGETIFVPSGWWHCVLNLETTIAVTQNFVNTSNFEFVCLDMAPGHYHKGVSRAGLLAIHDNSFGEEKKGLCTEVNNLNYSNMTRKEKRPRLTEVEETCNGVEQSNSGQSPDFFYDISFLSKFLDEERDHYNSMWSASNCIGQREMRQWLHKLWVRKPAMRDLIWKGADLALNVEKWSARMTEICAFHNLPSPFDDERLPVGTGSNPVYLVGDHVMKIYVEGGLEAAIHCLGTELEFYSRISEVESPLRDHIPDIVASGILFHENGCYKIVSWDGKGVPDVIVKSNLGFGHSMADGFTSFGVWSKSQFELRKAGNSLPADNPPSSTANAMIWPYIITKRCKGDIFAYLRDDLSREDVLNLASFLGDQLRNLHLLPLPSLYPLDYPISLDASIKTISDIISISAEWEPFMQTMIRRRKDVLTRLTQCRGDPIPKILIEKVEEYIPSDPAMLLDILKDENGLYKVCSSPTWIHSDVMDDNIHMEACCASDCIIEYDMGASTIANGARNGSTGDGKQQRWLPCHILDFSDMTIGEPIFDLIPIYLDIFRGDSVLLEQFLKSYKLPLARRQSHGDSLSYGSVENGKKFERISYRAMCYCILHDENVLGSIFSLWRELKTAKSWEEVEETAWGELNKYQGSY